MSEYRDASDFGTGAGFYLNATSEKYKEHYNMYDFITKEIPEKLAELPLVSSENSIENGVERRRLIYA